MTPENPTFTPAQLDTLLAGNHKNIAKKIAAGKTLSARELKILEDQRPAEEGAVDVPTIAAFWRVHRKTVHRWIAAGHPVADTKKMCDVLAHSKATKGELSKRISEVRKEFGWAKSKPLPLTTADIVLVNRSLREEVEEITGWILQAQIRMTAAITADEPEVFAMWDKVRRNYSDQKVRNLLAQAKLGLESGELVGKSDLAKLIRAFASRAWIALYKIQQGLCPKLVGLTTTREVMDRLEGPLFMGAYIGPFEHARDMAAGIGLPGWVVDAVKEGYMELVEEVPDPDPGFSI